MGRTLPGRGAWLCAGAACATEAIRRGTLARALGLRREVVSGDVADRVLAACVAAGSPPPPETHSPV